MITPRVSLVVALLALAAWIVLVFVRQVPSGLPHGLYAVAVLLVVRWMVLGGQGVKT
jgi:hypothetical protein